MLTKGKTLSAINEARLYLQTPAKGKAFFALLHAERDGTKRQHCYPIEELEDVLTHKVSFASDVWISQGLFRSSQRRISNLRTIQMFYVDLDTYKTAWAKGKTTEKLIEDILAIIENEIPLPTLIVDSGRGLQLKWIFEKPIPKAALPRWQIAEKLLIQRFAAYGADVKAADVARVLRLVGSTNNKSGRTCSVSWINEKDGQPVRFGFDYLLEFLLPKARTTCNAKKSDRSSSQPRRKLNSPQGANPFKRLNKLRLEDMTHVLKLRGTIAEGFRDSFLFHMMNAASLAGFVKSEAEFENLAEHLAKRIDPAWRRDTTEMSTLKRKLLEHQAREQGTRPLLYTFKTESIIDALGITEDEEKHLKTLVRIPRIRRRRTRAKLLKRRGAGMAPRFIYERSVQRRTKTSQRLLKNGFSPRVIARKLKVSLSTVYRYLGKAESNIPKSVSPSRMAKPIRAQAFEESVQQKGKSFSRVAPFVLQIDAIANKRPGTENKEARPSKIKHRFSDAKLSEIREKPILKVLDDLGFYMSFDRTFRSKKAPTQRVNVTRGNITEEVLFTKNRWYSTRGKIGGYGAIDFLMKLYDRNFIEAMEELEAVFNTTASG